MELARAALLLRVAETEAEKAEGVLQQAFMSRQQIEQNIRTIQSRRDALKKNAQDALSVGDSEQWILSSSESAFIDQKERKLNEDLIRANERIHVAQEAMLVQQQKLEQMKSLYREAMRARAAAEDLRAQKAADEFFLIKQHAAKKKIAKETLI
ncbi:MAG: flagellar FliJ family protein [Acidobacteria bacterium]|nr:flagellar FliJ family protein [Acidobacteriota bacterium]